MQQVKRLFGARSYSDILKEGLQYIDDRRHGRIKSFKTPWAGLNNAGIGGLEWGSMLTIGARPGAGKTMFTSQILREAKTLNPTQNFSILEFQFEMGAKQYAARQYAAMTALDYNQVLSSKQQLDDFSRSMMGRYLADCEAQEKLGVRRELIGDPISVLEMEKAMHHYYQDMGAKPMIVTIDHSWLIKKDKAEKEKIQTLYNTVEMLMQIKKDLPIIVVMITQLNRDIDTALRKAPGNIGNYPTSGDIFGGDALMQGSDCVVALNRPFKVDIKSYGPKGYITENNHIFMHVLKSRNSADDNNILFMDGQFKSQRMTEVAEFNCQAPTGAASIGGGGNVPWRSNRPRPYAPGGINAPIGDEI